MSLVQLGVGIPIWFVCISYAKASKRLTWLAIYAYPFLLVSVWYCLFSLWEKIHPESLTSIYKYHNLLILIWMATYSPRFIVRMGIGFLASFLFHLVLFRFYPQSNLVEVSRASLNVIAAGIMLNQLLAKILEYRLWFEIKELHLQTRNQEIENIFHSVHHAMLKIYENKNGEIVIARIRSHSSNLMFGLDPNEEEIDFAKAVVNKSDLPIFLQDELLGTIRAILGFDSEGFQANEGKLPSDMRITIGSEKKTLILKWKPIAHQDFHHIDTLLLTADDITHRLKMEHDRDVDREKYLIAGQLYSAKKSLSLTFLEAAKARIRTAKIEASKDLKDESYASIFREVHTIKGNANYPGFKKIVEACHRLEGALSERIRNPRLDLNREFILNGLASIEQAIEIYDNVAKDLSWTDRDGNIGEDELIHIFENHNEISEELLHRLGPSSDFAIAFSKVCPTLFDVMRTIHEDADTIALSLNKPLPEIELVGEDPRLRSDVQEKVKSLLIHLLSNSIDHGIEAPSERVQKSKGKTGRIVLTTQAFDEGFLLNWTDDGQGIDLGKIRQKAENAGLPSLDGKTAEEIANLIFINGFSTKESATEVSGRGIGLSAVADTLIKLGGAIDLVLDRQLPDGKFFFHFRIFIPARHWIPRGIVQASLKQASSREQVDVMIVDDDPLSLRVLSRSIVRFKGERPLKLVKFSNGKDALAFLETHDVSIVVTDIQMAGMNGFELSEAIRVLCREQQRIAPKVFGMTATQFSDHEYRQIESGMVKIFNKKDFKADWLKEDLLLKFESLKVS